MKKIHITIDVDGELEKSLAVLEKNGMTPQEVVKPAIAAFAKLPKSQRKKIFARGGGNIGQHI